MTNRNVSANKVRSITSQKDVEYQTLKVLESNLRMLNTSIKSESENRITGRLDFMCELPPAEYRFTNWKYFIGYLPVLNFIYNVYRQKSFLTKG